MENRSRGIILVTVGILGLILWSMGAEILFQHLITDIYYGDPGEPIWVLAPEYSVLIVLPISLLLFGLCVLLHAATPLPE